MDFFCFFISSSDMFFFLYGFSFQVYKDLNTLPGMLLYLNHTIFWHFWEYKIKCQGEATVLKSWRKKTLKKTNIEQKTQTHIIIPKLLYSFVKIFQIFEIDWLPNQSHVEQPT